MNDDLAELRERVRYARSFRPLPLPHNPAAPEADETGAIDGQCLVHAAAAVLRVPARTLPIVSPPETDDRWEAWASAMLELGYRIEILPLDAIPPAGPWVAIVGGSSEDATHAVPVIGQTVLRDGAEPNWTVDPSIVLSAFRVEAA